MLVRRCVPTAAAAPSATAAGGGRAPLVRRSASAVLTSHASPADKLPQAVQQQPQQQHHHPQQQQRQLPVQVSDDGRISAVLTDSKQWDLHCDADGTKKQQGRSISNSSIDGSEIGTPSSSTRPGRRALIAARRETEHEIQRALDAQRAELEQEQQRVITEAQREASEHEEQAMEALRSELDGERQRAVADALGAAREEERGRIDEQRRTIDEQRRSIDELQRRTIDEQRRSIDKLQRRTIDELQQRTIDEQRRTIDKLQRSIELDQRFINEQRRLIEEQRRTIEEKQRSIGACRPESNAAAMSDAHDAHKQRGAALEALRRDAELATRHAVAEARRETPAWPLERTAAGRRAAPPPPSPLPSMASAASHGEAAAGDSGIATGGVAAHERPKQGDVALTDLDLGTGSSCCGGGDDAQVALGAVGEPAVGGDELYDDDEVVAAVTAVATHACTLEYTTTDQSFAVRTAGNSAWDSSREPSATSPAPFDAVICTARGGSCRRSTRLADAEERAPAWLCHHIPEAPPANRPPLPRHDDDLAPKRMLLPFVSLSSRLDVRASLSSPLTASLTRHATPKVEPPEGYCAGGYHPCKVGDAYLHGRYEVVRKLGWGVYSTVWECVDTTGDRGADAGAGGARAGQRIALKLQKAAPEYARAAKSEIEILEHIASAEARLYSAHGDGGDGAASDDAPPESRSASSNGGGGRRRTHCGVVRLLNHFKVSKGVVVRTARAWAGRGLCGARVLRCWSQMAFRTRDAPLPATRLALHSPRVGVRSTARRGSSAGGAAVAVCRCTPPSAHHSLTRTTRPVLLVRRASRGGSGAQWLSRDLHGVADDAGWDVAAALRRRSLGRTARTSPCASSCSARTS